MIGQEGEQVGKWDGVKQEAWRPSKPWGNVLLTHGNRYCDT